MICSRTWIVCFQLALFLEGSNKYFYFVSGVCLKLTSQLYSKVGFWTVQSSCIELFNVRHVELFTSRWKGAAKHTISLNEMVHFVQPVNFFYFLQAIAAVRLIQCTPWVTCPRILPLLFLRAPRVIVAPKWLFSSFCLFSPCAPRYVASSISHFGAKSGCFFSFLHCYVVSLLASLSLNQHQCLLKRNFVQKEVNLPLLHFSVSIVFFFFHQFIALLILNTWKRDSSYI